MSEPSSGDSTRKALLVLGMHRAGTSALARVLALRGASLPENLLPANQGNVDGYWEPQGVVELNERIFDACDTAWEPAWEPVWGAGEQHDCPASGSHSSPGWPLRHTRRYTALNEHNSFSHPGGCRWAGLTISGA